MAFTDDLLAQSPPPAHQLAYLARISNACYADQVAAWVGPDASNVRKLTSPPTVRSYAYEHSGEPHVVIEGTTSGFQLVAQGQSFLNPSPWSPAGEVNGYAKATADLLFPSIPANAALLYGHSLGGALAVILGKRLKDAGRPVKAVVTFGCPREFTPPAIAGSWPTIIHVATVSDPVPLMPNDGFGGRSWRLPGRFYTATAGGVLSEFTQSGSSALAIGALFAAYGTSGHDLGLYADLLTVPQIVPIFGGGDMGSFISFKVKAKFGAQDVTTPLHYACNVDEPSLAQVADAIRRQYRANVLNVCNEKVEVLRYDCRRIEGIAATFDDDGKAHPVWRYADSIVLPAEAGDVDKGKVDTSSALPSFVTFSIQKTGSQWRDPEGDAVIPLTKAPIGKLGITGVSCGNIDDGAANQITAATVANINNKMLALRVIIEGPIRLNMVMVRNLVGGNIIVRDPGPPAVYMFQYSPLNSLTCSVNPGRRITRQQYQSQLL